LSDLEERFIGLVPGENPVRDVDYEDGDRQRHEHGVKEKSRLLRARVRVDRMCDFASQNAPPMALVLDRSRSCASTFAISSTFFFDIVCNCDRTFRSSA